MQPFRHNTDIEQTDGQTDGQISYQYHASMLTCYKNEIKGENLPYVAESLKCSFETLPG